MSAITTIPSDAFIQFSFVMFLNVKCRYRSLMRSTRIVPTPHHWALFSFAQSAKNIADPKQRAGFIASCFL
jgi:hypothetical protein